MVVAIKYWEPSIHLYPSVDLPYSSIRLSRIPSVASSPTPPHPTHTGDNVCNALRSTGLGSSSRRHFHVQACARSVSRSTAMTHTTRRARMSFQVGTIRTWNPDPGGLDKVEAFLGRNKGAIIAGAVVVALLIGGGIALIFWWRKWRERKNRYSRMDELRDEDEPWKFYDSYPAAHEMDRLSLF
ncbi:hypothetical protein JVT61DRAFT_7735 [Boletus reticuloceps]|uniref:Uncharacterized protein n=1 Tax=Boletus reticuloceps TaxID=495285 RepID=A0A8I2YHT8_9AGAM|nr:hypothetical protein JVT61DRAFT_7735 [Boletus reticuloceps]